jgi:hypothetical protein
MKDPAVLFYTNDFLAGTITMSDDQVGKYIRLLCIQHQKGILTPKDMLNICKSYDEDVYCKFIKDSDGNFYNERMKNESDRRKRYSESRKANRDSKPEKPVKKGNKKGKNISESYVKHMETETITETINENVNKYSESDFKKEIFSFKEKYSDQMLLKFFNYWSERNSKGKMRFELQKTWELSKRLSTWSNSDYNKQEEKKKEGPSDYEIMISRSMS